jgi:hypothetical protein
MLIDTNIFLEVLLGQAKAQAAINFLNAQSATSFFVSDFSLNSIGLKLFHAKKQNLLEPFYLDLEVNQVQKLSIESSNVSALVSNAATWKLDFDDAYQYTIARRYGLDLVSFDADFDKTDLKRIEPQ